MYDMYDMYIYIYKYAYIYMHILAWLSHEHCNRLIL